MKNRNRLSALWFRINGRFIEKIRSIQLRFRLLVTFLLMSFVPIMLLSLYSNNIYKSSMQSTLSKTLEQSSQLLENNLIMQLNEYSDYISMLSVSSALQDCLGKYRTPDTIVDPGVIIQQIHSLFKDVPSTTKQIKDVSIVNRFKKVVYSSGYSTIDQKAMTELLEKTDKSAPRDYMQFIHTYYGKDCVVICRKIYDLNLSSKHIGYIVLAIDASMVSENVLPSFSFGDRSNLLFSDSTGNIIASQDKKLTGKSVSGKFYFKDLLAMGQQADFSTQLSDSSEICTCIYNQKYNIYVIASVPLSSITEKPHRIESFVFALAIPLLLFSVFLTSILYSSIILPINRMLKVSGSNVEKNLNMRNDDLSVDELGVLARAIDDKTDRIEALVKKIEENSRQERALELEILQYQINPHFLFNTLNTFKWIAELNSVPMLRDGIGSLIDLLKNILVNKDDFIPLEEEITNVRNYCTIQNLRYVGQFEVDYFIDENTKSFPVPHFLLQPLVENAILHGNGGGDEIVKIAVISSFSNDGLHLSIRDNGIGFDPDQYKDKSNGHFTGIGLSNVDERLRLCYGDGCRLTVVSRIHSGTSCSICIPLTNGKGKKNV
jgi:two-component system sensor histidine kinase YesM